MVSATRIMVIMVIRGLQSFCTLSPGGDRSTFMYSLQVGMNGEICMHTSFIC